MRSGNLDTNGIQLHYEDYGNLGDPAVLLVMGLSAQLTLWPEEIVNGLVASGYRVIRFDNRDIGLSGKGDAGIRPNLPISFARARLGMEVRANYTLHDMVDDTIGLADALGIARFHLAGVSMGGMISQLLAGKYPERVNSLVSIMSSTNSPRLPQPRPDVLLRLMGVGDKGHDEEAVVRRSMKTWNLISGPHYKPDPVLLEERIRRDYQRSYRPSGILRQTHGIIATGSIEPWVKQVRAPTLVIHGDADPLVRYAGGQRSAALIPGARLQTVSRMGHDMPRALLPDFVGWMTTHFNQAAGMQEQREG